MTLRALRRGRWPSNRPSSGCSIQPHLHRAANTLTIYGAGRNELLVYDAAPRNPVRGEWQVTAFNNGADAVVSPILGTEIDIAFGLASVGGFAGCNSFSGTYGTNGNIIRSARLPRPGSPATRRSWTRRRPSSRRCRASR